MNYPNGVKKTTKTIIKDPIFTELSHKNRGMTLENDLNITNEYYCAIDKAYIYKKPTPIKITKVDYPSRNKAVIKEKEANILIVIPCLREQDIIVQTLEHFLDLTYNIV